MRPQPKNSDLKTTLFQILPKPNNHRTNLNKIPYAQNRIEIFFCPDVRFKMEWKKNRQIRAIWFHFIIWHLLCTFLKIPFENREQIVFGIAIVEKWFPMNLLNSIWIFSGFKLMFCAHHSDFNRWINYKWEMRNFM